MVVYCCVKSCDKFGKGVKFHRIPKDEILCRKWLSAIGREDLVDKKLSSYWVCDGHFSEDQKFPTNRNRTNLKKDSIPNVDLPNSRVSETSSLIIDEPSNNTINNITVPFSVPVPCCVCLNDADEYKKIGSSIDEEPLIFKLKNLVPEVEWSEDYNICQTCTTQLELAYNFRNLCIKLDSKRKSALPKITQEIFSCYHCGSGFNNKDVLIKHIHTHQNEKEIEQEPKKFDCDHCDKWYSTQKVLKEHSKKCNSDNSRKKRNFSCEVCNLALSQAKQVVEHCIREHSMGIKTVKPYTCDECPMRFSCSANLIQHKKYHKGSRSHICSFCGKSYITKSDLTVHEYTHFNRRNYKCEFCAKAFNTNKNLRSHILVVHTNPSSWKYGCDLCSRRFPLKSGFEQHMKRHTGDKKFVCHICDKSFVSRSELHKHMGYHSIVKPFKCDHCDKAYKEKRLYEIHLTKSHGIGNAKIPVRVKKFACHVCPNTFFDKQKLERHLRTHSGVKPYLCVQCDRKFSDKYYLKQHLKNAHSLDDEEIDSKLKLLN